MKKWVGLYIMLLLLTLGIFGITTSDRVVKQTDIGMICEEGGYISQVLRTKKNEYILYRNPEQDKFQIAKVDKTLLNETAVGTVHQDGVYYLFQYEENNKTYIGIRPLGDAKTQEAAEIAYDMPVLGTAYDFLAASSGKRAFLCSVIGSDGRTVTEYALLNGADTWITRQSFSLPENQYVACAAYQGKTLWLAAGDGTIYKCDTILQERETDIDDTVLAAALEKEIPEDARTLLKMYCIRECISEWVLPSLVIAGILTAILCGARRKNNFIFRIICCIELVTVIAVSYIGITFVNRITEIEIFRTAVDVGYALDEMRSSQRADGSVVPADFWKAVDSKEELLDDLIIFEPRTGEVIMSKKLPAGVQVQDYYGEDALSLASKVAAGKETVLMKLNRGNNELYSVALRDWTNIKTSSVIAAIISQQGLNKSIDESVGQLKLITFLAVGIITFANIAVFLYYYSRWRKYEEAMLYVSREKKAFPENPMLADGMESAWTSLRDIGSNLNRLYYERNVLYRSYYKFVPKGLEQLLNKPVLADIEVGDKVKVSGCIVDIVLEDMKGENGAVYQNTMTKSMELMHKAREEREGIFLSASTDLHERKVFFEHDPARAMQFSIDMIHAYAENGLLVKNNFIMLLHADEFNYGISGTSEMMTPYMYCKRESVLEPYAKELAKAKVRIAMTEETLRAIGGGFCTRYIGFVSGGRDGGSLKLYEGLDAYPETQCKLMMETDTLFQDGLRLFYSNDFYLARNTFNEVLKRNEQDQIAKWYLFHCEYHLNNPDAEVMYGLFENRII